MKTARKAIMAVLCVLCIIVATITGTLAYLTDSESVTNTFTVGNVGLKLDEAKVTQQGVPYKEDGKTVLTPEEFEALTSEDLEDLARWQPSNEDLEQEYHLLPGQSYVKDPTVTVDKNSEESYVRMMVKVTYDADADKVLADHSYTSWFDFSADWTANGAPETTKDETAGTVTRTYEFRYKDTVKKSENETRLAALFTKISVPGSLKNDELATLEDLSIVATAHAIQKAGFDTADAAWAAFDAQHPAA